MTDTQPAVVTKRIMPEEDVNTELLLIVALAAAQRHLVTGWTIHNADGYQSIAVRIEVPAEVTSSEALAYPISQ